MNGRRIDALVKKIDGGHLDAFLVSKPDNLYYLTSFRATHTHFVVSRKKVTAITDFIYAEAARDSLKGFELIAEDSREGSWRNISGILKKDGIKKIGFEANYMRFADFKRIKSLV